jgi:glycosyltransferase involved in cell wall biosynthesis
MKILIADFDISSNVGGGQTFYRKVFEKYPDLQFTYLLQDEAPDYPRLANVKGIPYQQNFLLADFKNYLDASPPRWSYRSFVIASNIAASVAGQHFDLIEIPDYQQWGIFLRPALQKFQVSFDKLVLSLHGKISTTIRLDWFNQGQANISLDLEEKMQYQTVDLRYGISRSYLDEWYDLIPIAGQYFNPLHFIELPQPLPPEKREGPPDLIFVGRTEKRKGPDIFVELAWWLPRSLYRQARTIGAASLGEDGTTSDMLLQGVIQRRLPDIQQLPSLPRQQLFQEFAGRSLTLIPSRYDTLNLVALESLFAGCPTAIGDGAGVCHFLTETFPQIPFIKLDTQNPLANLPVLTELLTHYDDYRDRLAQALREIDTQTVDPTLPEIYHADPIFDIEVRSQLATWYEQLMAYWNRQFSASPTRAKGIRFLRRYVKPLLKGGYQQTQQRISHWLAQTPNRQLVRSPFLYSNYQSIFNQAEATANDIEDKLLKCWNLSELLNADRKGLRGKLMGGYRIDRARCWRQIARLEQLRGNDLIAATFWEATALGICPTFSKPCERRD